MRKFISRRAKARAKTAVASVCDRRRHRHSAATGKRGCDIQIYLGDLVATHLYGKNPAEAAGRLVEKQIESLVEKGTLKKRKF
jgi:hypothetical protein